MPNKNTESGKGAPLGRKVPARKTRKDGLAVVNVPKDKPGNTKVDQSWIDRHAAELTEVGEDEELPFGVRYRWSGEAPSLAGEFLTAEERPCAGRAFVRDNEGRKIVDVNGALLTRPCARVSSLGAVVCSAHGGLTPQSLQAAKTRLLLAAEPVVARLISIALDPSVLDADAIKAINSVLDRAGIRAGVDIDLKTPEWQTMLKEMFEREA